MKQKQVKEKEPDFFTELGGFMKPYSKKYVLSIVISIISVIANILSYVVVGLIITKAFENNVNLREIFTLIILAVIFKLANAVLLNLSTWISHKQAYLTLKDIRLALTKKMLKLPLGYFEENGSGRLKAVLVDHVEQMEKTLAHMLPELTANLLGPLLLIIYMFILDYRLALVCLIYIIFGLSVTMGMMKDYDKKYEGQINVFKRMNQRILEYVSGIEVIKNFNQTDSVYSKYQDSCLEHANYNINWQKETQKFSAFGMAIAPFSVFPVLIAGLYFYSKGSLSPATLMLMVILTLAIFGPIMQASSYFDELAGMGTNAKEINDILSYQELERGNDLATNDLNIEFRDVSFKYNNAKDNALSNINFKVNQGEMLALVGPSGAGKSTIAKLLAGYFDAKGDILIGNKNIKEYSQSELNKMIAYVDQETYLFDDTILNNIRLANPSLSDEKIKEICVSSGIDEFIQKLENGYETEVGLAGGKLSGGERQRIAIARAMAKDASIIILDEATASSDPENEASIEEAISATTKGKTLIVVAHRLDTITNANKILFINDGEIKAAGTHQELLAYAPYKHLFELGGVR